MGRTFALRGYPIVTTRATAKHLSMVDSQHRFPCGSAMAGIAHVGRCDVRRRLADGQCRHGTAVAMATDTSANHVCVIHRDHRNPGSSAVASLASIRSVVMAH